MISSNQRVSMSVCAYRRDTGAAANHRMPFNIPRTITPHTNVYASLNEITPIVPGLHLSSLMAARNIQLLKDRQITHILTILDFPVDFEGWSGKRLVIKLSDTLKTDLLSRFDECVDFIEHAIREGGNVLVHCMQGLSRSVSVVAAYLIRCVGMSAREALGVVEQKRG
jgi:hypothetical protein